jgi:hypothetical protein
MSKSARNAVDYLYEWAIEQGDWAILLTNKVISGNPLSDGDRDQIIDSRISSQGKATSTGNGAVISNN